MDTVIQDIRYALRGFARRPWVAAGAIASLTIDIAANTAIFSVVNGVLLKDVPGVTRPERLVEIARNVGGEETDVTFPLNEALEIYLTPQRLAAWVSGAMGAFGLLLALVGIYGTTAFLVSRRAREMAIRIALGATNGAVVRLIVLRGGRAPLIGLGIGLLLGTALTIGASTVMTGAGAGDPVVIAAVPIVVALTAALAMFAPPCDDCCELHSWLGFGMIETQTQPTRP